jgi:septum site-determining protein MinC
MSESLVSFKGNKDGIYIYIKEGNFKAIKEQLDLKLKNAGSFFKGGKVINFKGRNLTLEEKKELESIIKNKYGINVESFESIQESSESNMFIRNKSASYFQGIDEGNTKFIRTTVRSGQVIEYSGNLVILGDVNPGGLVIAKGNIIILGALRGVAFAGCDGNKRAVVAAFSLQPTQLRIGDIISRRPDNDYLDVSGPEIAIVKDDVIVIEPYLYKK